jgi:NitT/TauT family transport system substrate-binding protein
MFTTLSRTVAGRIVTASENPPDSHFVAHLFTEIFSSQSRSMRQSARNFRTAITAALLAAAVVIAFAPSSASAQGKPEKASLTIGLPVTTSTLLPVYLAEEAGYFKQEGLDVKLVAFRGGSSMVMGVVADSIQVGVGALTGVLAGISAGQDLSVFYGGFNMAIFDWYAVPKIKSFKEAAGTRIGVSTYGSSTDFLTRYALKLNGIDPKNGARIIQGGASAGRIAAMASGQLDINILAPPETFLAKDRGYNAILKQTDLAPDYPFHVFFATKTYIAQNPNTIRAVLRAVIRGMRLARSDKQRSIKTLIARVGIDPKYADRTYEQIVQGMFDDGRLPGDAGMNAFFDSGIEAGVYKERWPKEKYWNGQFQKSYNDWKP